MQQEISPNQHPTTPHFIPGPPQLPPLIKGQKIQSGPYTVTVTDEMVAQRERENQELYAAWLREQQRSMLPGAERDDYVGEFKHTKVRRVFIRKIFCILSLQLLFTGCVVAFFMFVDTAKKFMILHWYIWVIALILFIVSYCAISCSVFVRRQSPFNYICLCTLTLAMSYLSAFASVFYSIEVILMAIAMTAFIVIVIALIATFSKFDLTMRTGLLMIIGLAAIVTIVGMTIVLIFTYIKVLHVIISVVGTFLLSMVIITTFYTFLTIFKDGYTEE